jgi:teichuronic acid biosynthesis glycosyltransferase TuaH
MDRRSGRVLVIGTADWQQTIATNQHYMTAELMKDFEVTFVNSLGLRRPEFTRRDLSRVVSRLLARHERTETTRPVPEGLRVISPTVVPIHRGMAALPNAHLLKRATRDWQLGPGPRILWSYSPVTYGLEQYADAAVYHCVDLLAEFPGIDKRVIDAGERAMADNGFISAGSSKVVVEHLRSQGFKDPVYWPNVADTDAIVAAVRSTPVDDEVIRKPRALFAGNITPKKLNFAVLEGLLTGGVELHLAGPVAEGGGDAKGALESLVALGAIYHGSLNFSDLSRLMANCTVGLIPYAINPYTQGVSPLKTYEYLAAGLAVVSTPLPGVDAVPKHVIVSRAADFVNHVRSALPLVETVVVQERLAMAQANSWARRGKDARQLIHDIVGAK